MNIKTLAIHSVRNVLAVVIALGIGYVAYTVNPKSVEIPKAQAGSGQNVSGYAWSDTIGYISFNSTSDGSATSYGVNVDPATGNFSGQAWSSAPDTTKTPPQGGIGWISFDRAVTGNPPGLPFNGGSGPIAQVNTTTGAVTGWARALAGCEVTPGTPVTSCASTSAGAAAGGWDGWIKLAKDASDTGSSYGVQIAPSTGNFSGYAWGGASVDSSGNTVAGTPSVIGWINFAGTAQDSSTYLVKGPILASDCTVTGCTAGLVCNPITKLCITPGGSCSTSADCGGGQTCSASGKCTTPGGSCSTNADCINGQLCNASGVCADPGGSCSTNADCVSGQICNTTTHLCVNKPKTTFWQF